MEDEDNRSEEALLDGLVEALARKRRARSREATWLVRHAAAFRAACGGDTWRDPRRAVAWIRGKVPWREPWRRHEDTGIPEVLHEGNRGMRASPRAAFVTLQRT